MSQSGLIVRRSVRHELVLPAHMRIAAENAEQIRFVKGVADDDGWIPCDLVNFASGGAGVVGTTFVPRGARIELRITGQDAEASDLGVMNCRVMRVQMTDRRPAYLLGLAYIDLDEHSVASINSIIDRLEGPDSGSEA